MILCDLEKIVTNAILLSFQDGFPLQFEEFYLITAGVIDLRPSYHNANQIWPVGFRSNWHDKVTGSFFAFEVRDGGDSGPVFMVQRYPCSTQSIPIGSTVLTRPKFGSFNGENTTGKDYSATFGTIEEDGVSIQMMLTESSPPHLDADISSRKMGTQGLDSQKVNLSSDSFSQKSGDFISSILGERDSVGEFLVEGISTSSVWEMVSKTFLHACHEAYKHKGVVQFGCDHELCAGSVKDLDKSDSLSKFSHFYGPVVMPHLVQRDNEFHSICQLISKWLEQERFGLSEEFVQEIIEQLPGVSGCSEYKPLNKRKHHSVQQTVRSGFLQAKRKSDAQCQMEPDSYIRNLLRPGEQTNYSALRGHFPQGKPLSSKIPAYLIGDALQVTRIATMLD